MNEPKPPATYRVDDQEILLGFYKRLFWDRLVQRIPARITPNSLTIAGQVLAVLGAVLAGIGRLGNPGLYFVSAILFMAYLTLDNVDGAHARRTGQTSPLGEFLDHGLDGMASAALLLATAFMLQLEGPIMVLACVLGALGFVVCFWEQLRTGLLVIPKVSQIEGVTLLSIGLTLIAVAGEPTWLRFTFDTFTPGTVVILILLVGYLAACIPPVVRVMKKGFEPWELAPALVVLGGEVAFAALGANAVIPAVAAGLIGADITCRVIVLRHRGEGGPFLSPWAWAAALPLVPAAAAPDVWTPSAWAGLSLALTVLGYGTVLWRGTTELLGRAEARRAARGS